MTTGVQLLQSRQFFAGKADSQPPRQDAPMASPRAPKLMDQLHEAFRSRHYSRRTEQAYCCRFKRFIYFHNIRLSSTGGRQACAVRWTVFETGEEDYYADPHKTP